MLLLISAVALCASVAALKSVSQELPGREPQFFALYLILIAGLMGLVLTGDAFNLYVMLEITSITSYGLIAMGRGRAPLASSRLSPLAASVVDVVDRADQAVAEVAE